MALAQANGVNLFYEVHGEGEPVVLVHGSWVDSTSWDQVVEGLAASFRVLVYDRRGHSRSERLQQQGSMDEDGDDLADLLETLIVRSRPCRNQLSWGKHCPSIGHKATGAV